MGIVLRLDVANATYLALSLKVICARILFIKDIICNVNVLAIVVIDALELEVR